MSKKQIAKMKKQAKDRELRENTEAVIKEAQKKYPFGPSGRAEKSEWEDDLVFGAQLKNVLQKDADSLTKEELLVNGIEHIQTYMSERAAIAEREAEEERREREKTEKGSERGSPDDGTNFSE